MSIQLPIGATLHIATGYGAAKTMSAITNANPGVATLAASHGVVEGEILEITSGWPDLDKRIVRAGAVLTNDVDLDGINTSSTTLYPASGGAGSVREVTGWEQIKQIDIFNTEGGEQQFMTYQFLENRSQHRIPTVKSPAGVRIMVGEDTSHAWYALAEAADQDKLPRAIKLQLPDGAAIYYNAYVSLSVTPTMEKEAMMKRELTLSLVSDPTRYSA